jgi:hypothetical protein
VFDYRNEQLYIFLVRVHLDQYLLFFRARIPAKAIGPNLRYRTPPDDYTEIEEGHLR